MTDTKKNKLKIKKKRTHRCKTNKQEQKEICKHFFLIFEKPHISYLYVPCFFLSKEKFQQ